MQERKVLLIDNYDSFTFNLYQYCAEFSDDVHVVQNDNITIAEIGAYQPTHIVISPGPGTPDEPSDIGIVFDVLKKFSTKLPILGVCLGHQCIAKYFGGNIVHAPSVMHGKMSIITHHQKGIFSGIPSSCEVMRYHSLMVADLSDELVVTAQTDDGVIMGLQHKDLPICGVQFHPESIGTEYGKTIVQNFLNFGP